MSKQTEYITIRASKFHFDTGYKWSDHSKDSIKLTRKEDRNSQFVPKSLCEIQNLDNHEVRIIIQKWFCTNSEEAKEFFKNEL